MDVKELRLGNLFLDDEGNTSVCTGFSPFDHSARCDEPEGCCILLDYYVDGVIKKGYECDSSKCKPIRLTQDVLIKLGFTQQTKYSNFFLNKIELGWSSSTCEGDIKGGFYLTGFINPDLDSHLTWLHELQNIYFALTGEELNVSKIV